MLEHDVREDTQLEDLVENLCCEIMLPSSKADFFDSEDSHPVIADDKRRFKRRRFHSLAALEYRQSLHALHREPGWQRVYTKDISRGGLAFLHSEQLFPLEQMRILLPTRTTEPLFKDSQQCLIEVTRCHRWGAQCYEVAARFVNKFRDA